MQFQYRQNRVPVSAVYPAICLVVHLIDSMNSISFRLLSIVTILSGNAYRLFDWIWSSRLCGHCNNYKKDHIEVPGCWPGFLLSDPFLSLMTAGILCHQLLT